MPRVIFFVEASKQNFIEHWWISPGLCQTFNIWGVSPGHGSVAPQR